MSKDHHVKFDDDVLRSSETRSSWSPADRLHCPLQPFKLRLAATYVEDSRLGYQSAFQPTESKLRLYAQYRHPVARWLLCVVLACHLCLAIIEEPAVQGCHTPYWASMALEAAFIAFYSWRIFLIANFTPERGFKSDPKLIILCITIVVIVIDMLVYVGLKVNGFYCIRFSRAVRPVLCVCWPELRSVRVALRTLRRALPAVAHVALLYCAVLVTAALMAYKMLGHKGLVLVSGRQYFSSYWDSLFDMYVLVTTANHPDIMMPAFNEHVVYVTFFAAFLVLCYFIYMNVVLAVIYNSYKRQLKAEVLESFLSRQQQLQKAFDLLCHKGGSGRRSGVCSGRFQQLLLALPQRRSPALTAVLFAVLDSDNSNTIDRVEFRRLADLLSVEVSEIQTQSRCLQLVSSTLPRCSRTLTALVNSRYFQYFFDGLTVVNAVVISISEEDSWWDAPLEWCFLSCFLLEIALKLLTLGVWRFFKRAWNTFDFIVIGLAFAIGVAEAILDEGRESRLSLDVLLVLRVLRLVKIVGSVKSFQMIVYTLAKIVPSLTTYGAVILIFYYKFAIVGMEIFAGLIKTQSNATASQSLGLNSTQNFPLYCGNTALEGTDFWRQRYCNNNFNDVLHAFIVLFELTVVNQWHVLAYGFSAVTHSAARLFFLVFHLLCVTLLLNVFTAFVLEVFLLEYSASEGVMETQLESKIVALGLSETRRRRKFSTISHDELVMQDSDEEEDDYYLGKKTHQNSKKSNSTDEPNSDYRESDIGQIFKKRESSFALDGNVFLADMNGDRFEVESKSTELSPEELKSAINPIASERDEENVNKTATQTACQTVADVLTELEDLPNAIAVDSPGSVKSDDCEIIANENPCNEASDASPATPNDNLSGLDSTESATTPSTATLESSTDVASSETGAKPPEEKTPSETNDEDDSNDECCCDADSGRTLASLLADTSVRFHLSKSVRSVEVLLQRMFQEELQQEYQRTELRRLSMRPRLE